MTLTTTEAATEFLAIDASFKELKARHEAAVKVLKAWFHEHPDKVKYKGLVAFKREGPWLGLDIGLATKTLGDNLADCQVERWREILVALKPAPA